MFNKNGNTLAGNGRENVWDSQNRLVQTTKNNVVTTFSYGADGLRRSMTRGGVTTYYILDGQTVVQEWKDTNDNQTIDTNELVTYFNGQARYKNNSENPEERWYLFDGLGTVLGEVDEDGNVTSTQRLDVYGLKRSDPVGDAKSDHKFVGSLGHTTDSETSLTYMRARYYDPAIGRFISEDPEMDGNNWYSYCENNPVNLVDSSGKGAEPATIAQLLWMLGALMKFSAMKEIRAGMSLMIEGKIAGMLATMLPLIYGAEAQAASIMTETLGGQQAKKGFLVVSVGERLVSRRLAKAQVEPAFAKAMADMLPMPGSCESAS